MLLIFLPKGQIVPLFISYREKEKHCTCWQQSYDGKYLLLYERGKEATGKDTAGASYEKNKKYSFKTITMG